VAGRLRTKPSKNFRTSRTMVFDPNAAPEFGSRGLPQLPVQPTAFPQLALRASGHGAYFQVLQSPKRKLRETAFLVHESYSLGSRLGLHNVRFRSGHDQSAGEETADVARAATRIPSACGSGFRHGVHFELPGLQGTRCIFDCPGLQGTGCIFDCAGLQARGVIPIASKPEAQAEGNRVSVYKSDHVGSRRRFPGWHRRPQGR